MVTAYYEIHHYNKTIEQKVGNKLKVEAKLVHLLREEAMEIINECIKSINLGA